MRNKKGYIFYYLCCFKHDKRDKTLNILLSYLYEELLGFKYGNIFQEIQKRLDQDIKHLTRISECYFTLTFKREIL